MAEIVREGVPSTARSDDAAACRRQSAEAARHRRPVAVALKPARVPQWSSTLCASDMACLLQVIETQLLPRLLSDYRPDATAPLRSRTLA